MEIRLTEREMDVMDVLWEEGASTVAEVRARLGDDLAYTTVLTVLRTLEAKGYVGHTEEGKAHRYHARVERAAAGTSALRRLTTKLFRGSPSMLVTNLVEDQALSEEEITRLRTLLDRRLGGEG